MDILKVINNGTKGLKKLGYLTNYTPGCLNNHGFEVDINSFRLSSDIIMTVFYDCGKEGCGGHRDDLLLEWIGKYIIQGDMGEVVIRRQINW